MTKLDESAKGVFVIAVTPFTDDGSLDLPSTDTMVDFYLSHGATGLTVLGMMGEAPKLTAEESQTFVRRVLARVDNRVPVVVGVSAPGLAPMRELAESVMNDGAAGVMVAPPAGLKTDESIASYFDMVAEMLGPKTPWVLQDYPLSTGVQIAVPVIQRVILNHPNCVMLKHEDWPGLEKISALRQFQREGTLRPISILTGNGGLFLDFEMERGADGAMTGYAFPDMLVDVVKFSQAGERDAAHDLFDVHLPLIRYEQQQGVGLAVRKYVLQKRGAIAHDCQRAPASSLTPVAKSEVDYLLSRLARHDSRAKTPCI
jgi:4-hydroxy-tetrahydrodipicolinate synthase